MPPTVTGLISRTVRLLAIAVVCLLAIGGARAHGYIIRAIPEDRASLDRAPVRVQYWFSEALESRFSALVVRDQAGNVIAEGGVSPDDVTLLSARLPADLPDGAYRSELRIAFSSDGHVIVASQSFFVGQAAEGASGAIDDQAVPLEVAWRALLLASTMALFGAFVAYNVVLLPAWGAREHRAGGLPPRVMARLDALVIAALIAAALANIGALLQQTTLFFGAPLDRVIGEGLWNVVRVSTRFGDTWNWRMLLIAVIALIHAAGLYYRRVQPDLIRAGWAANVWACALLLGTWSVSAHAAGSQVLPWLALASDWLHGLAVGAWAGGALTLAWIMPAALRPLADEARRMALLAALRRFSRVAVIGLAVVITSGIYNASNWFTAPADAATPYGLALGVKLALIAVLLGFGAAHHVALHPDRFARWSHLSARLRARTGDFIGSLRLEAAAVLIVLLSAAWLSATPPPIPEIISPPPLMGSTVIDDRAVALTIAPGGIGVNTYDLQVVTENGVAVNEAVVRVRLIDPSRDWRGLWLKADPLSDGLFSAAGGEFTVPGRWWALIDLDGAQTALAFDVRADAAIARSRAPSIVTLAALLGVIAVIAIAVRPLVGALVRRLDFSPAAVTVAIGGLAAGVAIVVVGLTLSAQSAEALARAALPPPEIVNPTLPDADSLARGEALFAAACPDWSGARDFDELTERLARVRDFELYFALARDGWWSLPACAGSLDEAARWDVVNYVRTLEAKST